MVTRHCSLGQSVFSTSGPMKIRLSLLSALLVAYGTQASTPIVIPGPMGSSQFGRRVITLPNGNFVVVDDAASQSAAGAGAVYLYSPSGDCIPRLEILSAP